MFQYLHYGLAGVLGFVGLKMIAEYWFEPEEGGHLISPWASLAVIGFLLTISVSASVIMSRRELSRRENS